jgi:S-adenosylmethionine:tRNA ribosyltransferase-isomerase
MDASFLNYDLPPHLIAQEPAAQRDRARLLVLHRSEGSLSHHIFADLPELLKPGDLLILNDTRVLPARLYGRRAQSGGKWEGLVLRELPGGAWELLCQTRGRLVPGETIRIEPGPLELRLLEKTPAGHWLAQPLTPGSMVELLERHGHTPLPFYIRKGHDRADDRSRYQTVFAGVPGAVAAPTAGLHFTPRLFERLAVRGIERAFVTLHVGLGTFQPIQTEDFTKHRMHREWGSLPEETVRAIADCRARGGRVVAVGTTSVRVLETVAASGSLRAWSGETDLFIYPPYEFRAVDALITNFHLPRSTLLLLVAAFAGLEPIRRAYRTAIEEGYRFYSYGDAMLIL